MRGILFSIHEFLLKDFKNKSYNTGVLIDMSRENKNVERFIDHVRSVALQHGVKIKIKKTKHVREPAGNTLCCGYFLESSSEKTIVVARGRRPLSEWLGFLVHEYCHMLQWIERCPAYTNTFLRDGEDATYKLSLFESGQANYNKRLRRVYTKKTIACELDCERRAVKVIRKFELPINVEQYKRGAAIILYKYWLLCNTGRWVGESLENRRSVMKAIKPSLRGRFNGVPKKIKTLLC
jgi:hypothetical protein